MIASGPLLFTAGVNSQVKPKYRIYTVGDIPPDLKERIIAIHVTGILKGKGEDVPSHNRVTDDQSGGPIAKIRPYDSTLK